jgi:hypothetical protein
MAHVTFHNTGANQSYYNETAGAPPEGQSFYYDMATGHKVQPNKMRE